MEARRGTLLAETALESLQDVTIRRGWFASSLTIQTVRGAVCKVAGLNKHQASRVRGAMLDAAAARAAAVAPELVDVDETLRQLLQRGRYVRHCEMLAVHETLVSTVQQCGGLVSRHLSASARDAFGRLVGLEPSESIDEVREDVNQRFVSSRVSAVAAAADATVGARVTEEQAEAIATDEDVTLVLAGAGTGKTTVIAAKVAHLVRNESVDPAQILVLAFNKKAQREIVDRLTGELSAASVETFHAFGRRVVADCEGAPSVSKMATDDHVMRSTIDKILNELIDSDETSDLVTSYLTYHFEPCYSPFDFATDDEYEAYWRSVELRTLGGDLVKSIEELRIANFLTEHGVSFEYEPRYEHPTATPERRQYLPDFYLRDHGIYIEHFALDEDGNPPPHWDGYSDGVAWKRDTHRRHGTALIETYSWEHKRGTWRSSLRDKLEAKGVVLVPMPHQELLELLSETRISLLSRLLATFLNHVKTSNADLEVLQSRARARGDALRNLAFLDIFSRVHQRYEQLLTEASELDFHDFINRAARHIRDSRWKSRYRYVLVDEFQDISAGRMALLRALNDTGVAYFVVGDDWQSIYRFAGSDVSLVRGCGSHLGHVRQRTLSRTFRYGDGILVPSAAFIKKNPEQTQRPLRSNSAVRDDGVTVVAAEDMAKGVRLALRDISRTAGGETPEVLVLGRYNKSRGAAAPSVGFNTVHRAKGTEADYVVVLDLTDDRWGFPSQIDDDPLLDLVLPPTHGKAFAFAEERRLFYVALTRARNGTYLITEPTRPSTFVLELLKQTDSLRQIGELAPALSCPRCPNGRLVRSESHKTLRCTNQPHCAYQAPRCSNCPDGYIVVKTPFVAACTNPGCEKPPEVCPSCGLGVIVPRRSDRTGTFEGCTEYFSKLECTYTRNTRRGASSRRPATRR